MPRHLLLVDHENVHKLDLSVLDESFRAIVFVGALQNPPKASWKQATAHRFARVEFRKVLGSGGNALDFHIACELGRILETARDTVCIVLSRDKGFDPLLRHLNSVGLSCRRTDDMEALVANLSESSAAPSGDNVVCPRCKQSQTIEHHGGRWCTNCGRFATPPDPALLPSMLPGSRFRDTRSPSPFGASESSLSCAWCHKSSDMSGGIYDDGEWMCGHCISQYVE